VVQYQEQLDRTFAALADPTRWGILERLGRGRATISELAEPFGISLTGFKKQVQVLAEAELVRTEKIGRTRRCSLGLRDLDAVQRWIVSYRHGVRSSRRPRSATACSPPAWRAAQRVPRAAR